MGGHHNTDCAANAATFQTQSERKHLMIFLDDQTTTVVASLGGRCRMRVRELCVSPF